MLAHFPKQVDKVTVVDETLNYIRVLEQTLKDLEKKKQERLLQSSVVSNVETSREAFIAEHVASSSSSPTASSPHEYCPTGFGTWTSPNVVNICGQEDHFSVCSTNHRSSLFTHICCILDNYEIEVLSAHISCDNDRWFYMFHEPVNGYSDQLPGALSAEETFKEAAEEIIQCLP